MARTTPEKRAARRAAKRPSAGRRGAAVKSAALRIGFIGGGNMATAMVKGFIAAGLCKPDAIIASDVDAAKRRALTRSLKICTTGDNADVARTARVLILAVKPQILAAVLEQLRPLLGARHLIVSIAAGWPTARLEAGLGAGTRVVRVMPNTPSLLGKGMAVAVRGRHATATDERLVLKLLRTVGLARAVGDEALIDAVTGVSGSGPAYVYRFAEALIAGGTAVGLRPDAARELALQTLTGAAAMLQETGETPEALRAAVTSPGGTTFAGLRVLDERGFFDAVVAAVAAATARAGELGRAS